MLQSGILRTIVCYPNSGEEWNASTETWVQGTGVTSPKAFADGIVSSVHYVRAMLRGKRYPIPIILGGCCRTTLETTRSMRRRIDSLNVNQFSAQTRCNIGRIRDASEYDHDGVIMCMAQDDRFSSMRLLSSYKCLSKIDTEIKSHPTRHLMNGWQYKY